MQEGGEISDHSGALSREMGKEELNEGKETARNGRTGRVEPIVHLFQQSHTPVNVATTAKPIVSDESLFGQFTSPCSPRISIADRLRYRLLLIQKKKKRKKRTRDFPQASDERSGRLARADPTMSSYTRKLNTPRGIFFGTFRTFPPRFPKDELNLFDYSIITHSAAFFCSWLIFSS